MTISVSSTQDHIILFLQFEIRYLLHVFMVTLYPKELNHSSVSRAPAAKQNSPWLNGESWFAHEIIMPTV